MNAKQLAALRSWLVDRLPRNPVDPSAPLSFPAENVYKQTSQDAPRTALPVCTYLPLGGGSRGSSPEHFRIKRAHRFDVTLAENPAADFVVEIGHWILPDSLAGYDFGGPQTITPGVDIAATVAATLAAFQALEGPDHPATYTAGSIADTITITAIDAFAGWPLRLETSDGLSEWAGTTTRDVVEVWTRDLAEEQISIRIETKQSGELGTLPEEAWAYHLAEKLADDALAREGWEVLAFEGVSLLGVSGPVQVSGLLGNAQGTEISTLTLRLGVLRLRGKAAGTIECLDPITGTLEGAANLTVTTRITP